MSYWSVDNTCQVLIVKSLLLCRPHDKRNVLVLCFLYRRSNLFETHQGGKVVQHR